MAESVQVLSLNTMDHDVRLTTKERHKDRALPSILPEHLAEVPSGTVGQCSMSVIETIERFPARVQLLSIACVFLMMLRRCRMHASELIELARHRIDRYPPPSIRAADLYITNQIN